MSRRAAGMSFVTLMYHSLSDGNHPDAEYPKYSTTRKLFREHMSFLVSEGFETGSFGDLLRRIEEGRGLPARYCVVTIDDGHRSSLDMAEIMADTGVQGTFFVTMGYCGTRSDFLSGDDIKRLHSRGCDFGTHGVTHRSLAHMPERSMASELEDSKKWLENLLGKEVRYMSLPAGQANRNVYERAYRAGYSLVGNSREQLSSIRLLPSAVNRFGVLAGYDWKMVAVLLRGSMSYVLKRRIRAMVLSIPKRMLRSYDRVRERR